MPQSVIFSRIAAAVERGDFDAGVLIHEGRFVYRERELELVAQGQRVWENRPMRSRSVFISQILRDYFLESSVMRSTRP